MSAGSSTTCPTCKKPVLPRAENKCAPFCSERCRQVDLGRWLNEEYALAAEEDDGSDGEPGLNDSSIREIPSGPGKKLS